MYGVSLPRLCAGSRLIRHRTNPLPTRNEALYDAISYDHARTLRTRRTHSAGTATMDRCGSSRGRPRRSPPGIRRRRPRTRTLDKGLHAKGLPLSRLARENLAFDGPFVIFDGRNLCTYPDAAAAIAAVEPNAAVSSIC